MKKYLEAWFDTSPPLNYTLIYDQVWGGILSYESWYQDGRDYGNGKYNDHHFHYGYFIYAAAVILKYDPTYYLKDAIMHLIRDIANPNGNDTFFPVTRHKDWFEGHSWAQGLDKVPDSKNQESTSESVNAYYAIMLFGMAIHNQEIENLGRLLLAMEIRSTKVYWHIPSSSDIYPDLFSKNKMVGVLWSTKVDYATFFGPALEFIHCIQMIPFTPISEELLDKPFIQEDWTVLQSVLNGPILEEWKSYVLEAMAILDKERAWKEVLTLTDEAFNKGNTRTNTFWWVATR